ncbi:hypothetical protein NP493_997g01041 [Ridgeia piscesae]|uniref:Uncharacterized protein n=1 Tax=Ridgeia piscesae TaxID=27915 RepID=A0AAD9KI56_RIDPI|nr:hypothetical protein NP493_997g01041 [Ridgeia piscesae]
MLGNAAPSVETFATGRAAAKALWDVIDRNDGEMVIWKIPCRSRRCQPGAGVVCNNNCRKHSIRTTGGDTGGHRESGREGECTRLHHETAEGKPTRTLLICRRILKI